MSSRPSELSKEQYEEISKQFRNESTRDPVARLQLDYTKYEYKRIITSYDKDPNRVERYEQAGWEIMIEEREGRHAPITGTLPKSGHRFVLMRCLKTRREQNELDKDARDKAAVLRSTRREVRKEGNRTRIIYPEVKAETLIDNTQNNLGE